MRTEGGADGEQDSEGRRRARDEPFRQEKQGHAKGMLQIHLPGSLHAVVFHLETKEGTKHG